MGRPKKVLGADTQENAVVEKVADEEVVEVEAKKPEKIVEPVHINTVGAFSLYQVGNKFVVKNNVGQLIGNPASQEEGMSLLTGFARSGR